MPTHQTLDKKALYKFFAMGIGGILVISVVVYMATRPPVGSLRYGICKTFLELYESYPEYLNFTAVYEESFGAMIDYTTVTETGDLKLSTAECTYQFNDSGARLVKVTIDGKPLDPKYAREFNDILPVLYTYAPDTILPEPLPYNLVDLKRDY